jgi:hypothetical protein
MNSIGGIWDCLSGVIGRHLLFICDPSVGEAEEDDDFGSLPLAVVDERVHAKAVTTLGLSSTVAVKPIIQLGLQEWVLL